MSLWALNMHWWTVSKTFSFPLFPIPQWDRTHCFSAVSYQGERGLATSAHLINKNFHLPLQSALHGFPANCCLRKEANEGYPSLCTKPDSPVKINWFNWMFVVTTQETTPLIYLWRRCQHSCAHDKQLQLWLTVFILPFSWVFPQPRVSKVSKCSTQARFLNRQAGGREAAPSRCIVAAGRSSHGVESYAQPPDCITTVTVGVLPGRVSTARHFYFIYISQVFSFFLSIF